LVGVYVISRAAIGVDTQVGGRRIAMVLKMCRGPYLYCKFRTKSAVVG